MTLFVPAKRVQFIDRWFFFIIIITERPIQLVHVNEAPLNLFENCFNNAFKWVFKRFYVIFSVSFVKMIERLFHHKNSIPIFLYFLLNMLWNRFITYIKFCLFSCSVTSSCEVRLIVVVVFYLRNEIVFRKPRRKFFNKQNPMICFCLKCYSLMEFSVCHPRLTVWQQQKATDTFQKNEQISIVGINRFVTH